MANMLAFIILSLIVPLKSIEPTPQPTKEPTATPTQFMEEYVAAYHEVLKVDNHSIIYEFETQVGYTATYDLKYLIEGYINGKYYKLTDDDESETIYFNLGSKLTTDINNDDTLCVNNEPTYDYGYIFEASTNFPFAPCYSLGRNPPIVELYDAGSPEKGIKVIFRNGDGIPGDCLDGTSSIVNFLCLESDQYERFHTNNGLNDGFVANDHRFSELNNCQREVEIYTSAACPYQCVTYDMEKDAISQCSANGKCEHDFELDLTRCMCNDVDFVDITMGQVVLCEIPGLTWPPTAEPTKQPSGSPTMEPTGFPTVEPTLRPTDLNGIAFAMEAEKESKEENDHESWMIMGIVLLSLIVAVVVVIVCRNKWSHRSSGSRYKSHERLSTHDGTRVTQLVTIVDDDDDEDEGNTINTNENHELLKI